MTHAPILVIGVTPHGGSDELHELLGLHPDLAAPRTVAQDHLTVGTAELAEGVRAIAGRAVAGRAPHEVEAQLLARVGDALLGWLAEDAGLTRDDPRRLLTRSGGAYGVRGLASLVPGAHLVLVVRDARDVVAVGMRELGWRFTEGVDVWLGGARELLRLTGRPLPLGVQVHTVRYEDLVADPVSRITDLLARLDLDPDRWDADVARARAAAWPSAPHDDLPEELHARLVLRAAAELRALDYPVARPPATPATGRAAAREVIRGVRRTARWVIGGGD